MAVCYMRHGHIPYLSYTVTKIEKFPLTRVQEDNNVVVVLIGTCLTLLVALVVPAIYGCSQKQPAPGSASRARDSVRHSHLITYGSAIAAALICLLLAFVSSVA